MGPGRVTLRFGDREQVVDVLDSAQARVLINAETLRVSVDGPTLRTDGAPGGQAWAVSAGDSRWVYYDGCVYELEVQREGNRRRTGHQGSLSAPMPATVRQIRVAVGDPVAQGDTLIVLEAMKMELPVRADADGTVSAVHCREGELVQPGRPLIDLAERTGA
jgi:biotin carboxyl carrier protein